MVVGCVDLAPSEMGRCPPASPTQPLNSLKIEPWDQNNENTCFGHPTHGTNLGWGMLGTSKSLKS